MDYHNFSDQDFAYVTRENYPIILHRIDYAINTAYSNKMPPYEVLNLHRMREHLLGKFR